MMVEGSTQKLLMAEWSALQRTFFPLSLYGTTVCFEVQKAHCQNMSSFSR
jgi:hypothetical protein